MPAHSVYEELAGQHLTSVQTLDTWGQGLPVGHAQARWPLFGAVTLTFGRFSLIVTSPLRYLRSQEGTRFGAADGSAFDIGARALLCDSTQAEALLWLRLGISANSFTQGWVPTLLPEIGRRLAAAPVLSRRAGEHAVLHFAFETGAQHRLAYRLELDGAIELSPERAPCELADIEVNHPAEPFGWLHPRAMSGFVVGDVRWRSAAQWPIEVRRRLRHAATDGPEVREQLRLALLAYFKQTPHMLRRLLALSRPARVAGIPPGLIEEVRDELMLARSL